MKIWIVSLAKAMYSFALNQQSANDKDCALYKYFLKPGNDLTLIIGWTPSATLVTKWLFLPIASKFIEHLFASYGYKVFRFPRNLRTHTVNGSKVVNSKA